MALSKYLPDHAWIAFALLPLAFAGCIGGGHGEHSHQLYAEPSSTNVGNALEWNAVENDGESYYIIQGLLAEANRSDRRAETSRTGLENQDEHWTWLQSQWTVQHGDDPNVVFGYDAPIPVSYDGEFLRIGVDYVET